MRNYENMPQSMKIYRYPQGPKEEEILEKIVEQKIDLTKTKLLKSQGSNVDSLEINNIDQNDYGVIGHARLWKQHKDSKYTDTRHLAAHDYFFTISKTKKLLLVAGGGNSERNFVVASLSVLIHEIQNGYFLTLNIPKEKILKLQNKLADLHTKNRIGVIDFDTENTEYKNRAGTGITAIEGQCARKDKEYDKFLENSDNLYPTVHMMKCPGLIDDVSSNEQSLMIKKKGEFLFYDNISQEGWNEFFFDICQPIIGKTVMN